MNLNRVLQQNIKMIAHSRPVLHGMFSEDGQYIFTAAQDSLVKVYCAYTGTELEVYGPHEGTAALKWISVTSDSRYIAVAVNSNAVIVHDRTTKSMQRIPINYIGVRFVQFTKDSKYLFVGTAKGEDGEAPALIKYSFPELKLVKTVSMNVDFKCCCLTPDDKYLWLGCGKEIMCYSTDSLEQAFMEEIGVPLNDLTIYRDAFLIVPVSDSFIVSIYSLRTFENIYNIRVHNRVNTAVINDKNNILTIGGGLDPKLVAQTKEGNNVLTQHYDLVNKELIMEQDNHASPTHRLRWSPDQLTLLSVSEDGSVSIQRYSDDFLAYTYYPEYIQV